MRTTVQKNLLTGACIRAILTVLRQLIHFIHAHQEVVPTININYRDPRPIYEQVRDGLRTLIVSGALAGGEKLPSVRELASQLAINPNTIQRAYRALEQEGYLYSVPGKGSFAAARSEIDIQRRDKLLRTLDETVRELNYLGVTREALIARIGKGENDEC